MKCTITSQSEVVILNEPVQTLNSFYFMFMYMSVMFCTTSLVFKAMQSTYRKALWSFSVLSEASLSLYQCDCVEPQSLFLGAAVQLPELSECVNKLSYRPEVSWAYCLE